jgi:hypothetical protein
MKKRVLIILVLSLQVFAVTHLSAQIGLTAGTEYGFGGIARVGSYPLIVELAGGLAPVFVFVSVLGGDDVTKLYFPFTIGGKLSFAVSDKDNPNRFGIKGGISYNGILRLGFGGGGDFVVSKSPEIVLSGCLMIFPEARKGIVDQINADEGTHHPESWLEGGLMEVQPQVSISVIF